MMKPGIYEGLSNEAYHAGPGVSKSQLDDIAVNPAIYLWRKHAPVDTDKTAALDSALARCYAYASKVLKPVPPLLDKATDVFLVRKAEIEEESRK